MYFQIDNSPQDQRHRESKKCVEGEINPRLTLAPFSPAPIVTFENILIGSTAVKTLEIFNPSPNYISLTLTKQPPPDLGLQLSWHEAEVGPSEQITLELSWRPINVVSQRVTMQALDLRKARFDIIVICKSFAKKKLLPNPPNRKRSMAPNSLGLKKSPKLSGCKKPLNKSKIYSSYEEVKKYESSTSENHFTQSIKYHKSPLRPNSRPVNSRVSEYWSESEEHFSSRRDTYLVSNAQDIDKENYSHVRTPGNKVYSVHNGKNDHNFSPTISVLSAIENLEFTPLKVCEKLSSKADCDLENIDAKNIYNNGMSPNIGRRQRVPMSPKVDNIDSLIDNLNFTPLRDSKKKNYTTVRPQIVKKKLESEFSEEHCEFTYERVEKTSVIVRESSEIVHYDLVTPNNINNQLNMNHNEKNSANVTHPIIDLLDSTTFSKTDGLEYSRATNEYGHGLNSDTKKNNINYSIPVINLDDSDKSKTDYSQFTPVTRNLSSLNDSLQSFNPKRCSTERKECGHSPGPTGLNHACKNLVFSPHDVPNGLNVTYERLSSGTYTKGESPIIPIDPSNRECLQSSPYSAEISPLYPISNNAPIQRSCPRKLPFSECSKGFNERTELRNAIKEKNSMNGVKSIIEANQWQSSPPRSISPGALASIPEESIVLLESSKCDDTSKRVQCETFIVNRTFDTYKPVIKPVSESIRAKTCNKQQNWKIKSAVKEDFSDLSHGSIGEQLASETYDYMNIRKVASTIDPFLASTCLYDKRAYDEMENEFKMWLNYLLTPPADLDSDIDVSKIDIGKTWLENRNKSVPAAPTKEQVSSQYHTSHRLESLRRSARMFIKNPEMSDIFIKVSSQIERKILSIRTDKNLQMDIGLQKIILKLLLCYNPLWLRIGLEALYGRNIPLSSNNDVMGLSGFIIERMFRDPYLSSKFPAVSKVYGANYTENIKKFTLKKFFFLVYFLDQAKLNKLIPHDPCLFCRNAPYKESREILFQFTKELLSGVGDITKHLKPTGYVVRHKQKYLDEFKYAVHNLAVDLQDGVRLTRLMEVILMKENLTSGLRTPAISLTQKFHNVQLALTALKSAGFEIVGDITAKDISKGHREKTLSLLWQIINKFRAPLFVNAAIVIQRWWRTKFEQVKIERQLMYEKQMRLYNSATKIQSWWKSVITRRWYIKKIKTVTTSTVTIQTMWRMWRSRNYYRNVKKSAVIIQRWYRDRVRIRSAQKELANLRVIAAARKIQIWYRKVKLDKEMKLQNLDRENFLRMKSSVLYLQTAFRSYIEMKKTRQVYVVIRTSTIKIQQYYRAAILCKSIRKQYVQLRITTVMIQKKFRANMLMKQCRNEYNNIRNATITIQRFYRNYQNGKQIRSNYNKLILATLVMQRRYRAKALMQKERKSYMKQRESAVLIQRYFKSYRLMKKIRMLYANQKRCAIIIQNHFRAYLAMKKGRENYLSLKHACGVLQKYYRAKAAMTMEKQRYLCLKHATIIIQHSYRALMAMKTERNRFLLMKNSAMTIQRYYKGFLAMKEAKLKYESTKDACIKIQIYFRAFLSMKAEKQKYLNLKRVCCNIQSRFRANQAMKNDRQTYLKLRCMIITVQRYYRAQVTMREQRKTYCSLKSAAIVIQKYFRGYVKMKNDRVRYIEIKNAVAILQTRYSAYRAMRVEREKYTNLKKACEIIQVRFRANRAMKEQNKQYSSMKRAANIIQSRFRAHLAMKTERNKYLELRSNCIIIQQYFRSYIAMRNEKQKYDMLKQATQTIQTYYRAKLAMKSDRDKYLKLKHASMMIQKYFRSRLVMKLESTKYTQIRQATITIQTHFRAYLAMIAERKKYLQMKQACEILQIQYRARLAMKRDYERFASLRKASVTTQTYYRALLRMRLERKNYLELKRICLVVQARYRAKQSMMLCRNEYMLKRSATIKIQTWYRRTIYMRTVKTQYEVLRVTTIKMQRVLRNNLLTKKCRQDYTQMKNACVTVQRHLRSRILMRQCSGDYNKMKDAAIVIQRYVRARNERRRYLKMKEVAIKMQDKYRSSKLANSNRQDYLMLKSAAKILQSKYRALLVMRETRQHFITQRHSAVLIQSFFRSYLVMKQQRFYYLSLKRVVTFVQVHYRSKLLAIEFKKRYLVTISSAIKIQSIIRMYLARKQYLLLRNATINIQKHLRNYLMAKSVRKNYEITKLKIITIQSFVRTWILRKKYLEIRRSVILIQTAYRRKVQLQIDQNIRMNRQVSAIKIQSHWRRYIVQSRYMILRRSVIVCQRRRRAILEMRKERNSYVNLRESVVKIQSAVCGWLTRRAIARRKSETEETRYLKRINNAATTIQRTWRGYNIRKLQEENCKVAKLRRRWQEGALVSNQPTLAERNEDALDVLCHFKDVASVIRAFKTLDYVTSVVPMLYGTKEKACPIIDRLVMYMGATNRSVSTLETLQLGVAILMNFTKFRPTAQYVYSVNTINTILTLMLRWCDKDNLICRQFCTLLWLFGKYDNIKTEIMAYLSAEKQYKLLSRVRCLLVRKKRMDGKKRNQQSLHQSFSLNDSRASMTPVKGGRHHKIMSPATELDYGIRQSYQRKLFSDEIEAIESVFFRFNLPLNIVPDN